MEGIITGIGDKELGKNLIKPEYDAVINDFIIGKSTILEGLKLNGNILSAGTCILCGYRGIIEESKTLDTTAYVYGKFTLNFGNGEDSFEIVTSSTALTTNVNPTEITSAGTYYLLLYISGVEQIDREHSYPKNSQYSVETENVLSGAVISETATTPTELTQNELGENIIVTDLHLTQPNRVVNTEYVHAQIEKEIDYEQQRINETISFGNGGILLNLLIQRKAKYSLLKPQITFSGNGRYTISKNSILKTLSSGFAPTEKIIIAVIYNENSARSNIIINTSGQIVVETAITGIVENSDIYNNVPKYQENGYIGYQCQ